MEPSCVRHTLIPATSKLFADFLYHFDSVAQFFPAYFADPEAFKNAAEAIAFPDDRRAQLVSALRELNGDSAALNRLAQPGTVAVVTGQQVGLFSGPAYTVYKAVTAAKLAQELTERGTPAVPVFWLATEDHDLAEVDHAFVFNERAEPTKVGLPATGNGGPVGDVRFDSWPLDALKEALGDLPYAEDVVAKVREAYTPGASLGTAFRTLLQDLLKELGLLFVDPLSPAIREICAPFLAATVPQIPRLVQSLRSRNKELEAAGYHAQVHVEDDSALLFLINGKRSPLRLKDGRFTSKERSYSADELAKMGTALSPNALLRPVMQDYLLPTIAYVGGPAEVAYMAQAQVLYQELLGRMPVIFPRNSYTLLDSRATKILDRYNLKVPDLLKNHEQVRELFAAKLVPTGLKDEMAAFRTSLAQGLSTLQSRLQGFDPTLAASGSKSAAKMLFQLDKLAGKTGRQALRRDERARADATYVLNMVYPERHLQERFYSILPFFAKYGFSLTSDLLQSAQVTCPDHMVRTI